MLQADGGLGQENQGKLSSSTPPHGLLLDTPKTGGCCLEARLMVSYSRSWKK